MPFRPERCCCDDGKKYIVKAVKTGVEITQKAPVRPEQYSQAEGDEEILTFDIPDEALERAASAEQQASTLIHRTHPWYYCQWPQ